MPVILLERLPIPSLEAYAAISASLFGCSLYYAVEKTLDQEWKAEFTDPQDFQEEIPGTLQNILPFYWLNSRAQDIIMFLVHSPLCIWVLATCCLYYF